LFDSFVHWKLHLLWHQCFLEVYEVVSISKTLPPTFSEPSRKSSCGTTDGWTEILLEVSEGHQTAGVTPHWDLIF